MYNNLNSFILKKITKTVKEIRNKPENEKVRIMWVLVIFCMIIMIGIWRINLDLNKPNKINSNNSDNLDVPSFPKLEEKLEELNKGVDNIEKIDGQELSGEEIFEEDIEETKTNKTGKDLEN